jgi:hypothetical protein
MEERMEVIRPTLGDVGWLAILNGNIIHKVKKLGGGFVRFAGGPARCGGPLLLRHR